MNDEINRDRPQACARVRERVEAWIDGELDPVEAARDAGHLEACADCAALAESTRRMRDALERNLASRADAAWLREGLSERLSAATPPRRSWSVRLLGPPGNREGGPVLAAAAAVLTLVGLSSTGLFDDFGDSVEATTPSLEELRESALQLLEEVER